MTLQGSARAVVLRQTDLARCLGGVCRREPVLGESLWNHLLQRQSMISVAEWFLECLSKDRSSLPACNEGFFLSFFFFSFFLSGLMFQIVHTHTYLPTQRHTINTHTQSTHTHARTHARTHTSEGLTRRGPDDSCTPSLASGPDPFGQNLTQSARTKSDTGWFCTV